MTEIPQSTSFDVLTPKLASVKEHDPLKNNLPESIPYQPSLNLELQPSPEPPLPKNTKRHNNYVRAQKNKKKMPSAPQKDTPPTHETQQTQDLNNPNTLLKKITPPPFEQKNTAEENKSSRNIPFNKKPKPSGQHNGTDQQNKKLPPSPETKTLSSAKNTKNLSKKHPQKTSKQTTINQTQNESFDENKAMLISVIPGEQVEVAITNKGELLEYFIEMTHHEKIRGNIYKGVINNIDANLQAAFVNYGNSKNGFLQIDEVHPEYYLQPHDPGKSRKHPPIQKVLKAGQEILVQVVKEPTGSKGAFLTTWLSLAGRFLVLTPGQEQIGISRKVENEEERTRLRELIKGLDPGLGLGAIVRTVSAGTSKTTLQKDLNFLKRVWKDIRKKATTEPSPSLIYQEPDLATRAVRDYLAEDITEIWVDEPETAHDVQEITTLLFPRKTCLVHLYQNNTEFLWEHFKLNKQITQVHSREVAMPSGGRLVFDQTEALMAIDINSGRITGKTNFESMAYRTNMEAATTIAQQLRLRDVGGQIVIDFIEMKEQKHCRDVERELQNAMRADRARYDIGKMSSFGLLQIVRQRTGSSAISITQEPCPNCKGTGQRRNIEWQAIQILRELHKKTQQASSGGKTEYTHPLDQELALYILNHKRNRLLALEEQFGIKISIAISGHNQPITS